MSRMSELHAELAAQDDRARDAASDLLSIAKRWVALEAGAWNPDRYERERAQLTVETEDLIADVEGGTA